MVRCFTRSLPISAPLFRIIYCTTIALSVDCAYVAPKSRNEKRISSALELARKITMYNSRYKTAGNERQEPVVQPTPLLRPRTPVQPYPYFPWQPKGDCLSSTKVQIAEHGNSLSSEEI